MTNLLRLLVLCVAVTDAAKKKRKAPAEPKVELKLKASWGNGQEFPLDHRGNEDNISPALSWTGVPKNTKSFVLVVESDVPAKGGGETSRETNWVVYDIPSEVTEMKEELSSSSASDVRRLGMKDDAGQAPVVVDPMGQIDGWVDPEIAAMQKMIHGAIDASFEEKNRAKEGANSFGGTHWKGPSKAGTTTTFKLYALNGRLDELPPGTKKEEIKEAMKGKILQKATLTSVV